LKRILAHPASGVFSESQVGLFRSFPTLIILLLREETGYQVLANEFNSENMIPAGYGMPIQAIGKIMPRALHGVLDVL
jgi:hypothetical protein